MTPRSAPGWPGISAAAAATQRSSKPCGARWRRNAMRAYLPSFAMRRARAIDEALDLLAHPSGGWRPFAGGTDLMVQLAAGALRHHQFVSLWGIDDLRRIDVRADGVGVGALVTFTDIQRSDPLRT